MATFMSRLMRTTSIGGPASLSATHARQVLAVRIRLKSRGVVGHDIITGLRDLGQVNSIEV